VKPGFAFLRTSPLFGRFRSAKKAATVSAQWWNPEQAPQPGAKLVLGFTPFLRGSLSLSASLLANPAACHLAPAASRALWRAMPERLPYPAAELQGPYGRCRGGSLALRGPCASCCSAANQTPSTNAAQPGPEVCVQNPAWPNSQATAGSWRFQLKQRGAISLPPTDPAKGLAT